MSLLFIDSFHIVIIVTLYGVNNGFANYSLKKLSNQFSNNNFLNKSNKQHKYYIKSESIQFTWYPIDSNIVI